MTPDAQAYECSACGCALWTAASRRRGRCNECRYVERNERLARVIAEQRVKLKPEKGGNV